MRAITFHIHEHSYTTIARRAGVISRPTSVVPAMGHNEVIDLWSRFGNV